MKEPVWEVSPGALAALINGGQFVDADLITITLAGGNGILRFTSADVNVTYPSGPTWDSRGVRLDPETGRQRGHWTRGLDLDQWVAIVMPRLSDPVTGAAFPDQINGVPWIQGARQGALDAADFQVDRAYLAAWPQPYQATVTPVGILTIFAGRVAEVDTTDVRAIINVNDYRELLTLQMPRNLFQAGCRHTLFGAGCGLTAGDFDVAGTAIGGTTRASIKSAPLVAPGSGTFMLGRIRFLTGANAGFSRTITQWSPSAAGTFGVLNPFPYEIIAGDTFAAYPGCDKSQAACTAFGNLVNFGGAPFIPAPETAI